MSRPLQLTAECGGTSSGLRSCTRRPAGGVPSPRRAPPTPARARSVSCVSHRGQGTIGQGLLQRSAQTLPEWLTGTGSKLATDPALRSERISWNISQRPWEPEHTVGASTQDLQEERWRETLSRTQTGREARGQSERPRDQVSSRPGPGERAAQSEARSGVEGLRLRGLRLGGLRLTPHCSEGRTPL